MHISVIIIHSDKIQNIKTYFGRRIKIWEKRKIGKQNLNNMTQKNIEEFSRLQSYMSLVDKDSDVYKVMKIRYIELKVILTAFGVNLTELDIIKE